MAIQAGSVASSELRGGAHCAVGSGGAPLVGVGDAAAAGSPVGGKASCNGAPAVLGPLGVSGSAVAAAVLGLGPVAAAAVPVRPRRDEACSAPRV